MPLHLLAHAVPCLHHTGLCVLWDALCSTVIPSHCMLRRRHVIRDSARQEFEASRHQRDPQTVSTQPPDVLQA